MKRLAPTLLVALLAALSLTGCVQMRSETVIEKDGSGNATLVFSVSEAIGDAMKEMKELGMDKDQEMQMPLMDDIDRADLEKAAKGRGVKITKFEKGLVDGRQTLTLAMNFQDLEGLSFVMGSAMGEGGSQGMGIFDAGDGNFVLKAAEYDFPAAEEAEEEVAETEMSMDEMTPEMMQKQMEIMGKMMGAMAEMEISMKITVPGDIVSSNAPTVEGRTSIWKVDSSNMMTAGQDMEPEIVFSGKGLKIKAMTE